jgi:hypothetical protein
MLVCLRAFMCVCVPAPVHVFVWGCICLLTEVWLRMHMRRLAVGDASMPGPARVFACGLQCLGRGGAYTRVSVVCLSMLQFLAAHTGTQPCMGVTTRQGLHACLLVALHCSGIAHGKCVCTCTLRSGFVHTCAALKRVNVVRVSNPCTALDAAASSCGVYV